MTLYMSKSLELYSTKSELQHKKKTLWSGDPSMECRLTKVFNCITNLCNNLTESVDLSNFGND